MKRFLLVASLILLISIVSFAKVTDFVPANASMVGVIENNPENYDALKKAGIFGFLLRDMGLEGMLTQQFESMKYADPDFDPENIWGLLKGDMAIFTVGEINFEPLMAMQQTVTENGNSAMDMMDPTAAMLPLMSAFQNVSICLVLEPTVNPDDSLATLGKLMGMPLEYGPSQMGFTIEKVGNTLLVGMGMDAISAAKSAKSNPITSNANFMEAYSSDNWMTFYSPFTMDTKEIMKVQYPDMPTDFFDNVKSEYSWTKVYVKDALVFDSFVKNEYKNDEYKQLMVNSNSDLTQVYQKKLPGFVKGTMEMNNFKTILNYIKPIFDYSMKEAMKQVKEVNTDAEKYVWEIIDSLSGKGDIALDLSMGETGEMVVDMLISCGMTDTSVIKELIEKEKGQMINAGNYSYIMIPTDDGTDSVESLSVGNIYLILFADKLVVTTITPENYDSVLSSSPSYADNSVFKALTDKYSLKQGIGVAYVDFSKLLTSFLGMAYPSGMLIEAGSDMNGNNKSIVVIK